GRAVVVGGGAGMGKARVLEELSEQTASIDRAVLRLQCSSYHVATALFPFVEWIRSSAGIELGTDERAARTRLEALVDGLGFERQATIPLLAPLLSVPLGDEYETLRLSLKLQ